MSQRRIEIYALGGLLVILAAALYFRNRADVPGLSGVFAADTKFEPLEIQEPQLHTDQLQKLQKSEYAGSRRNIFVAAPPPAPAAQKRAANSPRPFVGPVPPPPPPPLQIPAQFFGYAAQPHTGKRVAFLTSGEDVFIVAEGDSFLNRFRLVHIGNDSADFEEISTGRHATLALTQPPEPPPN
jgi:hypothetical protein